MDRAEAAVNHTCTVGLGIPGTLSPVTGKVKNANSVWLNGQPLDKDLERMLGREVRIANDANCLAVSEAVDGAAAGKHMVFGVIIGTGCGGGIAIDGKVHVGATVLPENGDTIHCHGKMSRTDATPKKSIATVASQAVRKCLFQVLVCGKTLNW